MLDEYHDRIHFGVDDEDRILGVHRHHPHRWNMPLAMSMARCWPSSDCAPHRRLLSPLRMNSWPDTRAIQHCLRGGDHRPGRAHRLWRSWRWYTRCRSVITAAVQLSASLATSIGAVSHLSLCDVCTDVVTVSSVTALPRRWSGDA